MNPKDEGIGKGLSRLERGLVHFFYDDQKWHTRKVLSLRDTAAKRTSVNAADAVIARHTFMEAVTVKDWNLRVRDGATNTGADVFAFAIGKSLGGTGTVAQMGTATVGTQADNSVVDATLTETNFSAGDDIVLTYLAGTALPAGAIGCDADVEYQAHFVA